MSLHIPGVAGWLAGVRGIRSYSLIYTGYTLTHPATHSDTIYQPCSIIIHPFSILALLVTQPSTHSSTISTLLNHYPSLCSTIIVIHSTIHPLSHFINPVQSLSIPFLLVLLLTEPSTHSATTSTLLNHYPSLFFSPCHSLNHPLIHHINPAQSITIPFLLALLLTQPSTHSSIISTLLNQYPHILRLPITHSTTTRLPSTLLNHLATHLLISYLHT